jgi:hypothetical protein
MYVPGVDTLFVQNKCFTVKWHHRFLHNKVYQLPFHVNKMPWLFGAFYLKTSKLIWLPEK